MDLDTQDRLAARIGTASMWKTRLFMSHPCCQDVLTHTRLLAEYRVKRARREPHDNLKITTEPCGLYHLWYREANDYLKKFILLVESHGVVPSFEEWNELLREKHPDGTDPIGLPLRYTDWKRRKVLFIARNTPAFERMRTTFPALVRTYHNQLVGRAESMGPRLKRCNCGDTHNFKSLFMDCTTSEEDPDPSDEGEDEEDEDADE